MMLFDRLKSAFDDGMASEISLLPGDVHWTQSKVEAAPAAVLVAITARERPGLILTQRLDTLRKHAGQVAFPGGRIDADDDGPIAAALREAEEEVSLPREAVRLIGIADPYHTFTGYHITPVLGVIDADLPLRPNPEEVEAIFEVPLDFVLNPANHMQKTVDWEGTDRQYYEIFWNEHRIWGVTAAMIVNLSRRLKGL
jgi:8-oxo-dGTP pyrophosphatase MutT (NUDIX family)